jgi:hypothetical protein
VRDAQYPIPNNKGARSPLKFIQVLDEDEDRDPVIIDLKAIGHISQACHKLTINFQDDRYAVLETENVDILWKLLSEECDRY